MTRRYQLWPLESGEAFRSFLTRTWTGRNLCCELEGLLTCVQGERGVCLHTLLWIPTFPWPALRVPTSPVRPSSPGPWTGSLCQGFSNLCLHRHQGCLSRCVFTSKKSPKAKRHQPSLLITSLVISTSLTFITR